ncbi:MAG: hypothetical protein LBG62_02710 [Candidatus Methanoplasma sp.]|nr:hypothetical protein [Candidatus Methanoplasma sp.]
MNSETDLASRGGRRAPAAYAVVALLAPLAAVPLFAGSADSDLGVMPMLYLIMAYSVYPAALLGAYMWATGSGHRWINGIDWTKIPEEARPFRVSRAGKYLFIGLLVMYLGIMLTIGDADLILVGLIASTVGGTVVILFGILRASRGGASAFERMPAKRQAALAAASIAVLLAPVLLGDVGGEVRIDAGDESISVRAPLADFRLSYSSIDNVELREHFDRGARMMGYGADVGSGNWRNAELGDYTLAAYFKVDMCIVAWSHGRAYAFNCPSEEATRALCEDIIEKRAAAHA